MEDALNNHNAPINPLWRLHPYLSLRDAAALVAGYEPTQIARELLNDNFEFSFPNFTPALSVLAGAIKAKEFKADICKTEDPDPVSSGISMEFTRISTHELKEWMYLGGYEQGFFFPDVKPDMPGYLNPEHARYSPKLAASVKAWIAYEELPGKHPKQSLMRWLRLHAANFKMINDDGNPVEQAVEQCSAVANWQPGGGAPKTPGA